MMNIIKKFNISVEKQLQLNQKYHHLTSNELHLYNHFKDKNLNLVVPNLLYFQIYLEEFKYGFFDIPITKEDLSNPQNHINKRLCAKSGWKFKK